MKLTDWLKRLYFAIVDGKTLKEQFDEIQSIEVIVDTPVQEVVETVTEEVVETPAEIIEPTKDDVKPQRARNKGKFIKDDVSTPEVNEAWVAGKAPVKAINKAPAKKRKNKKNK